MQQTPPFVLEHLLSKDECQVLLDYLAHDDHRTDCRPDVRSKHPRWDEDGWPRHIIESALSRGIGDGFVIDEITFRRDKIGLKPHTDDGNVDNVTGKTMMILLDAIPCAQTVFFKNYWIENPRFGAVFTRTKWNPFTYTLQGRDQQKVRVEDIRTLLQQCQTEPQSVQEFDVTESFIDMLQSLIRKRSLPKLELGEQDQSTGYMQPGLRVDCYQELTDFQPGKQFDVDFHAQYLADVPMDDLEGLSIDRVIEWNAGNAIVFDRNQLHASSSNHEQKSFITIFYHHPKE